MALVMLQEAIIMNDEQKKVLSLSEAYRFGVESGLESEINEIRNMEIEWDRSYTSTVRRGFIVELFELKGIFSRFKELYWQSGNMPYGETLRRRYLNLKTDYENFLAGRSSEEISEITSEQESINQQFALEAHLRDFLAKNLERVESGLRLYEKDNQKGIEFVIDNGRIDILAIDKDNRFVVIELKLSRGRNKTIGQILYYMGWVDENLGNAPCRGVIIANEISDDLLLAARRIPDITLCRYHLSVTVERIFN